MLDIKTAPHQGKGSRPPQFEAKEEHQGYGQMRQRLHGLPIHKGGKKY